MEPFLNSGGAFRPQIVKVGALSAPTQEILLKYSLDLPYIQIWKLSYRLYYFLYIFFLDSHITLSSYLSKILLISFRFLF